MGDPIPRCPTPPCARGLDRIARRTWSFARVSTTDQRSEIQLFALRQYAEARGLDIVGEHIDHGVSGAKDSRPALNRMLAEARRRRFDVLAVTKLDRLARSVHHLTTLGKEFEALGIFDLWQDPQERYDIFMNNYTERTWTMVSFAEAIKGLMKTYIQYPPRKLQSMGYTGPITISNYQKFQWLREQLQKEGVNLSLPTGN